MKERERREHMSNEQMNREKYSQKNGPSFVNGESLTT